MCELGGTWAMAKRFFPVLSPGLNYSDLKGILIGTQVLCADSETDLDCLRDELQKTLNTADIPTATWNDQKKAFLLDVRRCYKRVEPNRLQGRAFLQQHLPELAHGLRNWLTKTDSGTQIHPWALILDIDGHGQINRVHGPTIGDRVLQEVPSILRSTTDTVLSSGRCGDDTFYAITIGTEYEANYYASEVLEGIRRIPERLDVAGLRVTASIGLCNAKDDKADAWITRAEQACYAAKTHGGNRVKTKPDRNWHGSLS